MNHDPRSDNLQWLDRHLTYIRQHIECTDQATLFESVNVESSRSGILTAKVQIQNQWKQIHSRYDPRNEAQRWTTGLPQPTSSVIVVLGWGLGYHVFEYVKKHADQIRAVVVFEPEAQLFKASLSCVDFRQWPSHISLHVILDQHVEQVYQAVSQYMEQILAEDFQFIALPFAQLYPQAILSSLRNELKKIMRAKEGMLRHMAEMGALCQANIIRNLPLLSQSVFPRLIQSSKTNQPAIIVAAGPSLDKNIDLLVSHQNRAWIIAVDTSLRILLEKGIKPHCVVTKDPTERNLQHFANLTMDHPPILAFDPQTDPSIPALFSPPYVWLPNRNNAIHQHLSNSQLTPDDHLPLSTNVALAAFNLANHMGCEPIIFMGLDLCFSNQEGASHASGSALLSNTQFNPENQSLLYTRAEAQDAVQTLAVEGIDGKSYPTIPTFYEALKLLETLITQSNKTCYDCSEGGAKIAGTTVSSLRNILDQLPPNAIQLPFIPEMKRSCKNTEILYASLKEIIEHLERCQKFARHGLQTMKETSYNVADLDNLREQIEGNYTIYHILQSALERLMVEISRPAYWDSSRYSDEKLFQHYHTYFMAIQSTCKTFIPLYKEAASKLK